MNGEGITFSKAREIALAQAKQVLRGFYPEDDSHVFEDKIIWDKNFWLFFRNNKIILPGEPSPLTLGDFAFAVGRYGYGLIVASNFDNEEALQEQVLGLSLHFAKKEMEKNIPSESWGVPLTS